MKEKIFNLDDCVMLLTSRSSKKMSAELEARFVEFKVTRVQWMAIYYIDRSKELTQKQLANLMAIKEPTVVRLIDRCQKEGLLIRVNKVDDKRKKVLKLTDKGRALNREMAKVAEKFMYDAIADISEEDLETYTEVMKKMLSNLGLN